MKCDNVMLTVYQYRKNVCILSIVHTSLAITSGQKAKPETVAYYNRTNQRKYSVKAPTSSWLVPVFSNILDLAAINASVLFKDCTNERMS